MHRYLRLMAPCRPNPIATTMCKMVSVDEENGIIPLEYIDPRPRTLRCHGNRQRSAGTVAPVCWPRIPQMNLEAG